MNMEQHSGNVRPDIERESIAKQILIVDDDVTFLKIVKKWLMGKYHVTLVKSGLQALQYLSGHRPDLILMDFDMPDTSGPKVVEKMRSESSLVDIPVLFLTGKADLEMGEAMGALGQKAQGYILKSMSQEHIVAAVDAFFATGECQITK